MYTKTYKSCFNNTYCCVVSSNGNPDCVAVPCCCMLILLAFWRNQMKFFIKVVIVKVIYSATRMVQINPVSFEHFYVSPSRKQFLYVSSVYAAWRAGAFGFVIVNTLKDVSESLLLSISCHSTSHHFQVGWAKSIVKGYERSSVPDTVKWSVLLNRALE